MTLKQAMNNIDSDMPKSVQIAGDVSSRFIIGLCTVLIIEQLLHIVIGLL